MRTTLLFGLIITTGLVTPWHNLEPSTLPKLAVLTLITCIVGILSLSFQKQFSKFEGIFSFCFLLAIALSLLNLIVNNQFFSERIFGVQGRNFGALSYVCLLITSTVTLTLSDSLDSKKILAVIKCSSLIVAGYFVVQLNGLDRASWVDAYNGIPSSTLGNPNFVSSFVAIGFVSTLPLLVSKQIKLSIKLLIFSISALELYVTIMSDSFQGMAIIFLCSLYVFLSFSISLLARLKKTVVVVSFAVLSFFAYFTLRFQNFLSIDIATIRSRVDYWEAGLAMGFDSPIFGKGFDYFGESYLLFRNEGSLIRGTYSDSAHNYFIDLLAFGGFPLLLTFLLPVVLVLYRGLRFLSKPGCYLEDHHGEKFVLIGLFLAWLGFIFQANLSPFNLALAYLGFLLCGFLYGRFDGSAATSVHSTQLRKNKVSGLEDSTISALRRSFIFVLATTFLFSLPILGIQALRADAEFRDGIEQGNGDAIYRIALSQPKNFQRMAYAAQIFLENEREDLAIPIIRVMVEENPAKITGWRLLEQVSTTEDEKFQIRAKISALDPRKLEANNDSKSKK